MKKCVSNCCGKMQYWCVLLSLVSIALPLNAQQSVSSEMRSADVEPHECFIKPLHVLRLGAESQGIIDTLAIDRGSQVGSGDVVAKLVSRVEKSQVEQAEQRAGMMGEVQARQADVQLAKLVLDRAERLHKQSLIPVQEIDDARAQYQVAQAALQQAKDNVDQLKLDLLRARALMAQRVVRSPIDGVVVDVHTFAGEYVQDNPIMTIAQLDTLKVEVVLPLKEFGLYKSGDKALVEPELGGAAVEAVVSLVDPLIDASSGTFGIRLLLDNTDRRLIAGQKCQVRIFNEEPVAVSRGDEKAGESEVKEAVVTSEFAQE